MYKGIFIKDASALLIRNQKLLNTTVWGKVLLSVPKIEINLQWIFFYIQLHSARFGGARYKGKELIYLQN